MKPKITLLITAFIFMLSACKKLDQPIINEHSVIANEEVTKKFFSFNGNINPIALNVLHEIKQRNENGNFVPDFAETKGFPVWDKAVVLTGGGNDTLVYIPLVLNKTRSTSGFIRATINQKLDIKSFQNSEYSSHSFSHSHSEYNADSYASMMMLFDHNIFGHEKFVLKDSRLFPSTGSAKNRREIKLISAKENNQSQSRTTDCSYVSIDISWLEPDPENCTCLNPANCDWATGCAACSNTVHTFLGYWFGSCGGGGGSPSSGGATWNPYPPPGAGGGTTIGSSSSGGWIPFPDDPQYEDFVNYTLTQSQQTFWNNPGKAGFVAPLINKLVQANFSYDSKTYVQNWINFLMGSNITPKEFQNYFMYNPGGKDGVYNSTYWDNPNLTFIQDTLPSLAAFRTAFPKVVDTVTNEIYPMDNTAVYQLVGGNPWTQHSNGNDWYWNACALRGSRGLNYCGKSIDNTATGTELGDDGKKYILSAKAFNKYMNKKFGAPTHRLTAAQINGNPQNIVDFLRGKSGIYTMVTSGGSYTGHVDLILNGECLSGAATDLISNVSFIEIWELQ